MSYICRDRRIPWRTKYLVIFGHYPKWLIHVARSGKIRYNRLFRAKSFACLSRRLRSSWLIKFE